MSNHGNKVHFFREEAQFSFPWETILDSSPYSRGKQGKEKEMKTSCTTTTTVDLKEHLPLTAPPFLTTTPRYKSMITRHGSLSGKVKDDPFFAAYMKCTKNISDTTEEKMKNKKKMTTMMMKIGKINYNYGRRIGARMSGFGFSCKSSHGVIEDAMIRLPCSPRSP